MQDISREGKQELIEIIIKHMKIVYKSIEINKINSNNIEYIFEQFKKFVITETITELSNNNFNIKYYMSTAELKFNRDFKSNPNTGNKLMDRPMTTKVSNNASNNISSTIEKITTTNPIDLMNTQNLSNDSHQYSQNLDDFLSSVPDDNLYSLDNIDKPLIIDNNVIEDESSFEDRLKKLKMDRDNIGMGLISTTDSINSISSRTQTNQSNISNSNKSFTQQNNQMPNASSSTNYTYNNQSTQAVINQDIYNQPNYTNTPSTIKSIKINDTNIIQNQNNIHKESYVPQIYNQKIQQQKPILKHIHVEVTNEENKTEYTYNFVEPLKNVVNIKLLSYSIPQPRYNIEFPYNNILKINYNNEDITIDIINGKYTIESLLTKINKLLEKYNINLYITENQYVIIEADSDIYIYPTELSVNVLGFNCDEKGTQILANRTWDLRIADKLYLFLENLSDNIPYGILTHNYQSLPEFEFNTPLNINFLNIHFKDKYNNTVNFYNLYHTLSFLFTVVQ